MNNLNILFLFETAILKNNGGIERVSSLLAEQFSQKGYRVIFVSTNPHNPDTKPTQERFWQLYLAGSTQDKGKKLIEIIKSNNIDIVINQSVIIPTIKILPYINQTDAKLITVLHNRPFSIIGLEKQIMAHTHDTNLKAKILKLLCNINPGIYSAFRRKQTELIYSKIIKHSDIFMLLSDKFKERLQKYCPEIDMRKVDAINNPNTFFLTDKNIIEKKNIVLFVGRLEDRQKNVSGFIDVWNQFSKGNPGWEAIIIGDGAHRKIIEEYAAHTKSQNLSFVGNQMDVASYYARAKFLCMTSFYEGWPMVIAEALAYGCIPFVYDTFESCHEIIDDAKTGFIIPPLNYKRMAEKMTTISKNETKRYAMAEAAQVSIQDFTPQIIADKWIDRISALLQH